MTLWSGKWESRGFLYGPIIPIYGFGASIGLLLFGNIIKDYSPLMVFVMGFVCSALLEYPTSYILEKAFHAVWWDYSIAPFNINGRVSLFSSIGFGLGALIIVYVINPYIWPEILAINENVVQLASYILIALVSADITLTVSELSRFEEKVSELDRYINEHMSNTVENINPKGINLKGAIVNAKENIIDEGVTKLSERMNYLSNGAISRIKGFRDSQNERIHLIKTKVKERIRKHER